jgi:TRAP-type mannitol/chloroaromatic compound transport system substrate-binding protein
VEATVSKTTKNAFKNSNADMYKKALANLEKELKDLQTQNVRIHDLLEQGIYDIDKFMERSKNIAERIENVTQAVEKTKRMMETEIQKTSIQDEIIPRLEHVLDYYDSAPDAKVKNELLKMVLDKVEYYKTRTQREDNFEIILYPKTQ